MSKDLDFLTKNVQEAPSEIIVNVADFFTYYVDPKAGTKQQVVNGNLSVTDKMTEAEQAMATTHLSMQMEMMQLIGRYEPWRLYDFMVFTPTVDGTRADEQFLQKQVVDADVPPQPIFAYHRRTASVVTEMRRVIGKNFGLLATDPVVASLERNDDTVLNVQITHGKKNHRYKCPILSFQPVATLEYPDCYVKVFLMTKNGRNFLSPQAYYLTNDIYVEEHVDFLLKMCLVTSYENVGTLFNEYCSQQRIKRVNND